MPVEWKQFKNTRYSVSDTGLVRNDKTNRILIGGIDSSGYRQVNLRHKGKSKMHSIHIMVGILFLGFIPDGKIHVINHKDSNKLNNHKDNLEIVTFRANCSIERTLKSSSQYTGVAWCKTYKKWKAYISLNGKLKHLGYFYLELDAHHAYQKALRSVESTGVV